jgi:hypothetical protein
MHSISAEASSYHHGLSTASSANHARSSQRAVSRLPISLTKTLANRRLDLRGAKSHVHLQQVLSLRCNMAGPKTLETTMRCINQISLGSSVALPQHPCTKRLLLVKTDHTQHRADREMAPLPNQFSPAQATKTSSPKSVERDPIVIPLGRPCLTSVSLQHHSTF